MRRITAIAVLTFGLVALLPAGATAGGIDWFHFRRGFYAPGDSVLGRTRVWFASEERARSATRGRFVAYLLPENRWLDPPSVPDAAIALGRVRFSSPDGNTAMATLEFTVPEVPNGDWNINVCNVPCTNSVIPDLVGGSIRIAASYEMARIMRLGERLDEALRDTRQLGRREQDLRQEVFAVETRNRLLEARIAALERAPKPESRPAPGFPAPIGWLLVAVTVLFGLVAFRPRKRPVLAPDPPAIERIDEADREPVR